ncbi:Rha family transcriptional regulator, partial [Lactobacillus sp. XV13L]|nr:Rha family transcriptional regulator [Lactobacillus sp. XV13L]
SEDISTTPNLGALDFFISSTYKDRKGEIRNNYLLTQHGCEFVANKLTGKKGNQFTAQYVELFNRMKQQITNPMELVYQQWDIPRTYGGALKLAAAQQEQLEKQRPKVEYYDSQMHNPGLMTTTEIAKDYGWSAHRLNQELKQRGVIYEQGKGKRKVWVPYRQYAGKGYTQYEPFAYDSGQQKGLHNILKWTQRGRKFIYDLLAKDGIRPTLEQMDLLEG